MGLWSTEASIGKAESSFSEIMTFGIGILMIIGGIILFITWLMKKGSCSKSSKNLKTHKPGKSDLLADEELCATNKLKPHWCEEMNECVDSLENCKTFCNPNGIPRPPESLKARK